MTESPNYINHIALVLDASGSMQRHARSVVTVADNLMRHLAQRSTEHNQETRVTVYVFDDKVRCVIYDKDVLRLPSIATFYTIGGQTALIDATLKSQDDLAQTAQLYGDHAFLTYVITDGQENRSTHSASQLAVKLNQLPDNWTVGAFVPDASGVFEAKKFGFPANNIAVWDTSSNMGIEKVGEVIRTATDAYMTARASGIRSTRNLFSTGADAVNEQTVSSLGLKPLSPDQFYLVPVPQDSVIKAFVESTGRTYQVGKAFYQLVKPETIQANKTLAVVKRKTAQVYLGREARNLVGLPDMEVRVRPNHNPEYDIYVQSTSVNRKLPVGTKLLILS